MLRRSVLELALFATLTTLGSAHAGTVNAAIAANFTKVARELSARFETETGNEVKLSFGSSGALYTQITQAAPFDVFFSADDTRTKSRIEGWFCRGGY